MGQSQAFLSYTRLDDEYFGGAITTLRKDLELAVRVATGDRQFEIFQDIEGIELGQQWQKRLGQALSDARFLIPVITPLFFSSLACRSELEDFIAHETSLGRDDLILPIYFYTTPILEKPDQLRQDKLALEMSKRQRYDWRSQAELPISDPSFRRAIKALAHQVASALGRTSTVSEFIEAPVSNPSLTKSFARSEINTGARSEGGLNSTTPKRVLWVDDRPDNNIYERSALERYNIKFVLAKSTEEAIRKVEDTKFDAIISDMGRPPDAQAGYTLLDAIRSNNSELPFFIYAGSRAPEHSEEAFRRGAQGNTNMASELISMVIGALRMTPK